MDKKTLPLIIVLAILVFAWPYIAPYLGLGSVMGTDPVKSDSAQVDTVTQSAAVPPAQTSDQTATPSLPGDQNPDLTALAKHQSEEMLEQSPEESSFAADTITVKTNKYTIKISSHGAAPVAIVLNDYSLRDGTPIDMLAEADAGTPEILFGGGAWSTGRLNFTSDTPAGEYDVTSGEKTIAYSYVNEAGSKIIRKYTFYADNYDYDLDFEVTDPASYGFESRYTLNWQTPMGVDEPDPKTDYDAMEIVAMQSDGRETLNDFDDDTLNQHLTGNTTWAGTRNMYFAAIVIPTNRTAEAASAKGMTDEIQFEGNSVHRKRLTMGLDMQFVSTSPINDKFTIFVGPLSYSLLSDYNLKLEDILGIGTTPFVGWLIKPFAIGIIWLLPRMYAVIPNYGWVIVLFAFLVKIITLPLSMKSFKSMQAMKVLQPELEKLKAQYKKNPQQMNQETMKLYKKHGVNPMAGCLPMLPQMPLFFALFSVFRSTILLRDAAWIWFIDDLSRGAQSFTDPYMLLVVFMVAAQFVSQKMTMGANPQNKMMMYFMPLFMGFIFRSFASGLVLYWTCFSVLSLLDWLLFKRKANNNHQVQTA